MLKTELNAKKGLGTTDDSPETPITIPEHIFPQMKKAEEAEEEETAPAPKKNNVALAIELMSESYTIVQDEDEDKEVFVESGDEGNKQVIRIDDEQFKLRVQSDFFAKHGRSISANNLKEALDTLRAVIRFPVAEYPIEIKKGKVGRRSITTGRDFKDQTKVYVDLAQEGNNLCVLIEGSKKPEVLAAPPSGIYFLRDNTLKSLPTPDFDNYSYNGLWEAMGLEERDEYFKLIVRPYLAQAFFTSHYEAYPWIAIQGLQNSGKTTAAAMMMSLMDPRDNHSKEGLSPIGGASLSVESLLMQAINRSFIGIDNASNIDSKISDVLANIATGGVFDARAKYENDTLHTRQMKAPGIITGITLSGLKADMISRIIYIEKNRISGEVRTNNQDYVKKFKSTQAQTLGAMFMDAYAILSNTEFEAVMNEKFRYPEYFAGIQRLENSAEGPMKKALMEAMEERLEEEAEGDDFVQAVKGFLFARAEKEMPADHFPNESGDYVLVVKASLGELLKHYKLNAQIPASANINERTFKKRMLDKSSLLETVGVVFHHDAKRGRNGMRPFTLNFGKVNPTEDPGLRQITEANEVGGNWDAPEAPFGNGPYSH